MHLLSLYRPVLAFLLAFGQTSAIVIGAPFANRSTTSTSPLLASSSQDLPLFESSTSASEFVSTDHETTRPTSTLVKSAASAKRSNQSTSQLLKTTQHAPGKSATPPAGPQPTDSIWIINPIPRQSGPTSTSSAPSRVHTTITITSKVKATVTWLTTLYNTDGSAVTESEYLVKSACAAEIPQMFYWSWTLNSIYQASSTTITAATSTKSKDAAVTPFGHMATNDTLPRNTDGTVYTSIFTTFANWDGINSAPHAALTTLAYPTEYWDYNTAYQWVGSTIGAASSCSPSVDYWGCRGLETLWSHPPYTRTQTQDQVTDRDDPNGLKYVAQMFTYQPGSEELYWFLETFPDLVVLRECGITSFAVRTPPAMPQIALTAGNSAVLPQATTTDIPASVLATPTDELFTNHLNPVVSVTVRTSTRKVAEPTDPATEDSTTLVAAQILSAALRVPAASAVVDTTMDKAQPTTFTFESLTVQQGQSQVLVNGNTVKPDGTVVLGSGSQTTAVAIATNADGSTVLQVGASSTILAAAVPGPGTGSIVNLGGQMLTVGNSQVQVAGQTVGVGSSITLGDGGQKTIVALTTDAAGHTQLQVGTSTSTLSGSSAVQTISLGGVTLTQSSDNFVLEGTTLHVGQSMTLGTAASATLVAVSIDAKGSTEVIVGGSTTILPAKAVQTTYRLGGESITQNSDAFLVDGKTLRAGQALTVAVGTSSKVIAVQTDSVRHTKLVVDGSTMTLPSSGVPITTAGLTVTPLGQSALIVDGKTLSIGGTLTLSGKSGITEVALTTDAMGRLAIVEPSTTIVLSSTTQIGDHILAGLQQASTTAVAISSTARATSLIALPTSAPAQGAATSRLQRLSASVMCTALGLAVWFLIS